MVGDKKLIFVWGLIIGSIILGIFFFLIYERYAAKSLQSCLTLCDPIDGSPPGSPSLGFSRQEHWSGLPFPSPMHESEKWKWSYSVVSNSFQPHGLQPTRLLHPWDFLGKSTGVGCHWIVKITDIGFKSDFTICIGWVTFSKPCHSPLPQLYNRNEISRILFIVV